MIIAALLALVGFVSAVFSAEPAAPADAGRPPRILVITSFGRDFAPFNSFTGRFRTELARPPVFADVYEVSLESARFEMNQEQPVADYIRNLFASRPLDLVVPVGGPAVRFAQRHRANLFPRTPMLLAGVEERHVQTMALTTNDTVVAIRVDLGRIIEHVFEILPQTTNVFVVIGQSPLERFWIDILRHDASRFTNRASFTWWNDLPFSEMVHRSKTLPPRSAIFFAVMAVDAKGVAHIEEAALTDLRGAANAPIFGLHSTQVGYGTIGGPVGAIDRLSSNSVAVAKRILLGESPGSIRTPVQADTTAVYDWRELRRWKVDESRLPAGSRILFHEVTPWERNRGRIIAAVLVCAAQAAIISFLLLSLARRRRAERSLAESDNRMTVVTESADLGLWSWKLNAPAILASDKWKLIHGYPASAHVTYDDLMARTHPEDRASFEQAFADARNDHGRFHLEHRLLLTDGTVRWISESGRIEEDKDGDPCLLGICIDITERKEAELAAREVSGKLITAQEDERRRIARDLHDDLNQQLALLSVETDLLGRENGGAESRRLISDISNRLREISSAVHKLSYQLHPAKLDQLGLVSATRSLCSDFMRQYRLPVIFVYEDVPPQMDRDIALCFYRLAQEGLQNTIKHSQATEVRVTLRRRGAEVELEISDNGRGFDLHAVERTAGLGLTGMRERVRLVHGRLVIESVPGRGTRIAATAPVGAKEPNTF